MFTYHKKLLHAITECRVPGLSIMHRKSEGHLPEKSSCLERPVFLFHSALQLIEWGWLTLWRAICFPPKSSISLLISSKVPSELTHDCRCYRGWFSSPKRVAKPTPELIPFAFPVSMTTTPHQLPVKPSEVSATPMGRGTERTKIACSSSTSVTWQEHQEASVPFCQFFCRSVFQIKVSINSDVLLFTVEKDDNTETTK